MFNRKMETGGNAILFLFIRLVQAFYCHTWSKICHTIDHTSESETNTFYLQ